MAYISAIHYITPKDCLPNSLKVVENTGQVDYAIKALEKLICITGGKLQRKRKSGEAFWNDYNYIFEIVTTPRNVCLGREFGRRKGVVQKREVSDGGILGLLKDRVESATKKQRLNLVSAALRATEEDNKRRDAVNAKLKARIEELESENVEFGDRLTKVEQNQLQNDSKGNNTPNNNSSNFNLGTDQGSLCERPHHEKSSQKKEMDNFLDEAHKKNVGLRY
ncbi:unnamed protein product [Rhizophagus irregularis]|nr:unnamed protein product [Rhizophagus irregularis]